MSKYTTNKIITEVFTLGNFEINEEFKLIRWASVLDRQFKIYVSANIKKFDLNYSEFIYLIHLYEHDGINQDAIAKNIYVDKSAITRTVQSLEKKDLITRTQNPNDKRAKHVFLTDSAKSYKKELLTIFPSWKSKLLEHVDIKDFENAGNILELIVKNILN